MSNDIWNLPVFGCMLWGRGGNMLKTSVLSQQIFLYILFDIWNSANNEKIVLIKIKKVSCGSQMACALGPEPPNFFYLAL